MSESTTLRVATWNINGIKARIAVLLAWLEEAKPDIVALQEIKSQDETFPRAEIEALGYHVETHGQKGFNGVALLSRVSPLEVTRSLPNIDGTDCSEEDPQARYIEGLYTFGDRVLRYGGLYLPNGNPVDEDRKYVYKLNWMERLKAHARRNLDHEEVFILAGDYNIIPQNIDCHDPKVWDGDALFRSETRSHFFELEKLGLTDALRAVTDTDKTYTFWDYQAGAWQKNNGIRIDHLMMSPEAADCLATCHVEHHVRGWEKPSDHVPVMVKLRAA